MTDEGAINDAVADLLQGAGPPFSPPDLANVRVSGCLGDAGHRVAGQAARWRRGCRTSPEAGRRGVIAVVTTGRGCYPRELGAVSQRKQSETSTAGSWCRQEEAVP